MDKTLQNRIKNFILSGVNEEKIKAQPDPFWQGLRKTGTELWLDTGDMDEAARIWTAEMTALTTNNTLVNNEIQKGIYDDFIAEARTIVSDLPLEEQVVEIAFILNARHGLRLAARFGGMVSVELHTNTAHDVDAIVDYGMRYFELCPGQFIVKVPYTAAGLLGARRLRELGVKINFTLEFSARQNVLVTAITKPNYCNVFLGRIGAYIKDNGLGNGAGAGERTVIETQRWVTKLSQNNPEPTRLIAASLRNYPQLDALAGVDVFTMPVKVAAEGHENMDDRFSSKLDVVYPVDLTEEALQYSPEKLWEVSDRELELALDLDRNCPAHPQELIDRVRESGCVDLFPFLQAADEERIKADGKIPNHAYWAERIKAGEVAIDTLLTLAGLASFTADQQALDDRIRKIIG